MASSAVGDFGRKLVDRAKTVVGRDWDTLKRAAKEEARVYGYRGSKKNSKARKPSTRSSR
jgi:hypothetical protein